MKVSLFFGAHAYACITYSCGRLDIRLEPGRPAPRALMEHAAECKARAARLMETAELAESAALILSQETAERKTADNPAGAGRRARIRESV